MTSPQGPVAHARSPRSLTGIKPTGMPHLGNYLGMIRPALAMTASHEAYYFIADYHALTTMRDRDLVERYTLQLTAAWLALGLDPARTVLFRQSDVPEVCELTWFLSCVTPLGLLKRAHAFKDAEAKGGDINGGTFMYPVLMAADILAYDSDVVPVGKDQKQHVEMARDMAIAFNHHFGDVLRIPEPVIRPEVATIPGLDGRKMSKSYDNTIPLLLAPKPLRKLIMSMKTDSTPLEEPKDPETCRVFELYRLLATPAQTEDLAARYRAGNFGYGHAKQELYQLMEEVFAGPRDRYHALIAAPATTRDILAEGAERAKMVAKGTLLRVRDATGIGKPLTRPAQ
ncbi:MAG: tryptophan--tRNA ligase [Pseudomonadota bacterium]